MYNESTYFKFELYTINAGSINSFGGSKVPIYWQRFFTYYSECYLHNIHFNLSLCIFIDNPYCL